MTADYTPTTDEIVRYYIDGSRDWFPGLTASERNERFDRWLAGEHARVLREAADAIDRERQHDVDHLAQLVGAHEYWQIVAVGKERAARLIRDRADHIERKESSRDR